MMVVKGEHGGVPGQIEDVLVGDDASENGFWRGHEGFVAHVDDASGRQFATKMLDDFEVQGVLGG